MSKKEVDLGKNILFKFVPNATVNYIADLVHQYRVNFKIVAPRKTKLGDCRYPRAGKSTITITVNYDLPKLQFLITTLHELAHAKTFREYQHKAAPHGVEWKNNFKTIFAPLLTEDYLTRKEIEVVQHLLKNVSASSCGNAKLNDYLFANDISKTFLKDIPTDSVFELNNRQFKIISKARTRYLCKEISSGNKYKIHGLANIKILS